ncbi:MAG: hypothetical protein ACOC2U_04685, partial [bacterium]
GRSTERFTYGLIPAYEVTGNEIYLNKLINVSEKLERAHGINNNIFQTLELYDIELFLWLYETTGNSDYLDFVENFMHKFIKNNIADDGYVYEITQSNATTPNGAKLPDDKGGWATKNVGDTPPGAMLFKSKFKGEEFKNCASIFSRNHLELLLLLNKLRNITNKEIYSDAFHKTMDYYLEKIPSNSVDNLFLVRNNSVVPYDTLAAVKSALLFKKVHQELYYNKLEALLTPEYFSDGNGILTKSVRIKKVTYNAFDKNTKNQSLSVTDRLFLNI